MAASHNRLWRRICHQSKLWNSAATPRILVTQQHFLATTPMLQPRRIHNPTLLSLATSTSFSTQAAASSSSSDDDDSDDSDFSDFSDFSDSDSDVEELGKGKSKKGKSVSTTKRDVSKDFQFDREDVSSETLMKDRLIISNLNFATNRNDLWELCEAYGTVTDVHLPSNKNRDYHNRGFGFVTFEKDDDAQRALDSLAGVQFNNRQLRAGFARMDTKSRGPPTPPASCVQWEISGNFGFVFLLTCHRGSLGL